MVEIESKIRAAHVNEIATADGYNNDNKNARKKRAARSGKLP
jgi:hypothetical protein